MSAIMVYGADGCGAELLSVRPDAVLSLEPLDLARWTVLSGWWERMDGGLVILVGPLLAMQLDDWWASFKNVRPEAPLEYLEPRTARVGFWRAHEVTFLSVPKALDEETREYLRRLDRCEDHYWLAGDERGRCPRCVREGWDAS